MSKHPAFKAYDIRGRQPEEMNPTVAYHVGRGLAHVTKATTAVLGMDSRESSPGLLAALAAGLQTEGVLVSSLGLCGTEEVYHAAGSQGYGLGVIVTASHNPIEYNGMKIVRAGATPFSHDVDMIALEQFVREALESGETIDLEAMHNGVFSPASHREDYVKLLTSVVSPKAVKPFKILMNAGNGAAGPTAESIRAAYPQLEVVPVYFEPDGTFPHGIPNPLLVENRAVTSEAVRKYGCDMGIAWDGDFDRCFLYDENGNFINNYYLCGLLARAMLAKAPGSAVVYDPRQYWDTLQTITDNGGEPHICKVGHGYFKPLMRKTNAVFGGEVSGHFYFRDFFYCDTGMLPWLLVLELMSKTGKSIGELVAEHASRAPASDEINFKTPGPAKEILVKIEAHYRALGAAVETVDGIGLGFKDWRANIRPSSNEPLLRLTVEAKAESVLAEKLKELEALIISHGARPAAH